MNIKREEICLFKIKIHYPAHLTVKIFILYKIVAGDAPHIKLIVN